MSGLRQPIEDVINRLKQIQVRTAEGYNQPLFVRVWNNQIARQDDGSGYVFQRPACFVEVINNVSFEVIGVGVRSCDLGIRIHLIHDYYNGDNMEQDLDIFDLRDKIIETDNGLSQYCPTACGTLNCISEQPEYDHDNTYHYVLDFVCNFIDSTGSKLTKLVEETTDIELEPQAQFIIPQITWK